MMETMIPPQVRMRLRTMREKEKKRKRERKKKKKGKNKQREKGHCQYPLPHLCFKVEPCFSYGESPMLSLTYTSGKFSLQDYMHTHLVFILSFHTLIALSASVAWQSLLLTLISIDGHLHSPLVSRIDVRLSTFLSSLYLPLSLYSIPPVVLYPWLALIYCVKVYEFEITKV